MLIYFVNQLFPLLILFDLLYHTLFGVQSACYVLHVLEQIPGHYTFGAYAYSLKFFNTFIVKMAFSLLLLCCWCYTSHLVEIASNYQLTRMVENFHVRANKVVGSHAGANIVGLKFLSAKKCLRTAFVVL